MLNKMWNWLIAAGALVAFTGMLFLPSALSHDRDEGLLGAGLAVFSFGALMIVTALYFKTQAIRAEIQADPNRAALLNGKRRRANCDVCHKGIPVVSCTMHKLALCVTCLSQHYDSRACVYVPALRRGAGRMSKAAVIGRS
jgi:hypothetical protein